MHSLGPLFGKEVRYKGAERWTLDEGGGLMSQVNFMKC